MNRPRPGCPGLQTQENNRSNGAAEGVQCGEGVWERKVDEHGFVVQRETEIENKVQRQPQLGRVGEGEESTQDIRASGNGATTVQKSCLRRRCRQRRTVWVQKVLINDQLDREREATKGTSWLGPIREMFSSKSNLYRMQLSIMSQLLSQWSGASSITIYAA